MSKDLAVEQMTFYDRMVDTLVDFMGGKKKILKLLMMHMQSLQDFFKSLISKQLKRNKVRLRVRKKFYLLLPFDAKKCFRHTT